MRYRGTAALIVLAAVLPPLWGSLAAHHDPRPTYDERGRLTIQGSLVSLTLKNPHSFIQVAVREANRPEVHYSIEWNGADALRRAGIGAATFRVGDRVIVTGQPIRDSSERRLLATKVSRPSDGLVWAQPMSQ